MKELLAFPVIVLLVFSAIAGSAFFVVATVSQKQRKRFAIAALVMAATFVVTGLIVRVSVVRARAVEGQIVQVKIGMTPDQVFQLLNGCEIVIRTTSSGIESITVIRPGVVVNSSTVIYLKNGAVSSIYSS